MICGLECFHPECNKEPLCSRTIWPIGNEIPRLRPRNDRDFRALIIARTYLNKSFSDPRRILWILAPSMGVYW